MSTPHPLYTITHTRDGRAIHLGPRQQDTTGFHRDTGPAAITGAADNTRITWLQDGNRHHLGGPADLLSSGRIWWKATGDLISASIESPRFNIH